MELSGYLFDIKHYSIHDGPGIRTTLFFSGCPLKCLWCHNPEAIFENQIMNSDELRLHHRQSDCIQCGSCIEICTSKAISMTGNGLSIDFSRCTGCGNCIEKCPSNSIFTLARSYRVTELIDIIEKDAFFYKDSSGGVTISGGEPFYQPEFLFKLISELKKREINVCIDTSGYFKTDLLKDVKDVTFLYDLKLVNDEKHLHYTGVSNQLILKNLVECDKKNIDIIISIPLIPGINTDSDDIEGFIAFIKGLNNSHSVRLLHYHEFALNKYERLGLQYKLKEVKRDDSIFRRIEEQFKTSGLRIQ